MTDCTEVQERATLRVRTVTTERALLPDSTEDAERAVVRERTGVMRASH